MRNIPILARISPKQLPKVLTISRKLVPYEAGQILFQLQKQALARLI